MTQCCVHCGADLFAYDRQTRQRKVALRGMVIGGFFMGLSALLFYGQRFMPDAARLWMYGGAMVSMLIAAGAVKD